MNSELALSALSPMPSDWWPEKPAPKILADLLPDISYRPGWEFELAVRATFIQDPRWAIKVRAYVQNSEDPGEWVEVIHTILIPDREESERWWMTWLIETIHGKLEWHENREWFRVRGEQPFYPHAEDGTAN